MMGDRMADDGLLDGGCRGKYGNTTVLKMMSGGIVKLFI